jgi:hypothetical protein
MAEMTMRTISPTNTPPRPTIKISLERVNIMRERISRTATVNTNTAARHWRPGSNPDGLGGEGLVIGDEFIRPLLLYNWQFVY